MVLAITQGGGLSGASRLLRLHHATILRRLNSFEHRMGVVLFDRSARGYEPTEAGEELSRMALNIEQEVEDAYRQLAGQDLRLSGRIRIATSDYIAQTLLPPVLRNFRNSHPSIEIEVSISPQYASLTKRDADIAIRATNDSLDTLVGTRIAQLAFGVYCHKELLEAYGTPIAPEQVDWVGVDHTLAHVATNQWRLSAYPDAQVRTRYDSLVGIYDAVRSGMGMGYLPHYMAVRDPDLICLNTGHGKWTLNLWLLTHPDLRGMNRIKAFLASAGTLLRSCRLSEIDQESRPLDF